jgi:16S rRNA (uracil1498-N3)-methyltransferase
MQRLFYVSASLYPQADVDLQPFSHQINTVLRLQVGAQLVLLDGQGNEFLTELTAVGRTATRGTVIEQRPARGEPSFHLTLYQCSLKADKFEWVLQKGTELGVACFAPVISARSIVRPADALLRKYDRWQAILTEAAEQSGRGRIPSLLPPLNWQQALVHATGQRVLAWENATDGPNLLPATSPLALLVGPEGGLTTDEVQEARSVGWQVIGLGSRILRAETASLVSIAAIMARAGELGAL